MEMEKSEELETVSKSGGKKWKLVIKETIKDPIIK
jgi:hypothetical protein